MTAIYAVSIFIIKTAGHNNEILKKPFYEKLNKALKNNNGIVCAFGKNFIDTIIHKNYFSYNSWLCMDRCRAYKGVKKHISLNIPFCSLCIWSSSILLCWRSGWILVRQQRKGMNI